jgi:ATP-dependent DNA helicase RecQ
VEQGHHDLKTFGIGLELNESQWRGVVRQLLAQRLLAVGTDGYGTLEVTEGSAEVLRGNRTVALRREAPRTPRSRTARKSKAADTVPLDGAGEERFERLRAWRSATAKEAGVPPYVVFHDATLRQIAAEVPRSLDALGGVSGVGAGKRDKWGAAVLETVAG